jgi:hypothetical protein
MPIRPNPGGGDRSGGLVLRRQQVRVHVVDDRTQRGGIAERGAAFVGFDGRAATVEGDGECIVGLMATVMVTPLPTRSNPAARGQARIFR